MHPTLTLCMIVRDEQAMLPDCLASVADVVDQIVVADTGSRDATADIAAAAGATLVRHPWQGDFAAARNAALAAATGDWILVLDADERLAPGAGEAIREAMALGGFDLGFLPLHNASRLDAGAAEVLAGRARQGEAVLLPRLIRRTPDLAWEGVIHESVDAWFSRGRQAVKVDADIIHLGNVAAIKQAKDKTNRNITLLRRAVVLTPEDAMTHAWLARELLRAGERPEAVAAAERAWTATTAAVEAGRHPSLVLPATLLAFLRLEDGDSDGALAVVGEAITLGGDHPNLDLLLANALERTGELALAEAAARCCLERSGALYTSEVMPGACSWAAAGLLGTVHLRQGDISGAIRWFETSLRDNPEHTHARTGLVEACLLAGEGQRALAAVEPLLGKTPESWALAAAAALQLGDAATAARLMANAHPGSRPEVHAEVKTVLSAYALIEDITGQPAGNLAHDPARIPAGEMCFAAGDHAGAAGYFVRALLSDPLDTVAWQDLGATLHAAGELSLAEAVFRQLLALSPEDGEALESLGHLLAGGGRRAEAVDVFRQLAAAAPERGQAALQEMGVESDAALPDDVPLVSVLLDATGGDPAPVLDRLALQDLPPALFEVVVVGTPLTAARPFPLRMVPTADAAPMQAAREQARGRWILLLQATDRPEADLIRRHLSALAASPEEAAVIAPRAPLTGTAWSPPASLAPLSNVSMPRSAAVALDVGGQALVSRLEATGLCIARPDIVLPHTAPATFAAAEALWEERGRQLRAAWEADPGLSLPALPGDPTRLEGWLGLRMLTEGLPPSPAGRLTAAHHHGLLGLRPSPLDTLTGALTSIIIPNLNGFPHLTHCVESMRAHTRGPVELVVVDNGSTDGSLEWLAAQPDVRLIALGENRGAPAARNIGLAAARGETIVFCDNDVVFTPQWRPLLLAHLTRWPDIGLVGPMSDYVAGAQKIDPMPTPAAVLDDYARAITASRAGQHIYTSRLILFFVMGRRAVFDQIGGICESYGRWGFEDDDLSIRAASAGWRLRIAGDCFIRHVGSQTARTANLDYDALLQRNWAVFKEKWGLPPEQPYGPYDPTAILARSFTHEDLYVPLPTPGSEEEPMRLLAMG